MFPLFIDVESTDCLDCSTDACSLSVVVDPSILLCVFGVTAVCGLCPAMKFERIGRDYHKAKHECIHGYKLYEDTDFKACDESLFYNANHRKNIEWKRPPELVPNPLMFHDKNVTCQVELGAFSNCWIMAAMDAITQHPTLFHNTVPVDQNFSHDYVGIFRFRIWRFGTWYEVTIDDKLPFDTETGDIYGIRSKLGDFWAPLLEKAYAKVVGRYEELTYVIGNDAVVNFTSGVGAMYSSKNSTDLLFSIITASMRSGSIVSAYRADQLRQPTSRYPWVHVFVRDIQKFEKAGSRTKLNAWIVFVRVKVTIPLVFDRDDSIMYNNALADNNAIDKYNLKVVDGEEWVAFETFIKIFKLLAVVDLPSSSQSPVSGVGGINQEIKEFHGSWVAGANAGGTLTEESFPKNPKHYFTLEDPDEGVPSQQTVVISLIQKDRKYIKHSKQTRMQPIGYFIYTLPESPFWSGRINWLKPAGASKHFAVQDVTKRFKLPLGTYMVVPCTYKSGRTGSYLLRIVMGKRHSNFGQRNIRKVKRTIYTVARAFYVTVYYISIAAGWALAIAALFLLGRVIYKMEKRKLEEGKRRTRS